MYYLGVLREGGKVCTCARSLAPDPAPTPKMKTKKRNQEHSDLIDKKLSFPGRPAPQYGEHAEEILRRELGMDDAAIAISWSSNH